MNQDPQQPVTVVNIVAVSYSGSTWLNFLLGANSRAFSVGEIDQMTRGVGALCTLHGERCPLWSGFTAEDGGNLYLRIARLSGRRVLVVNNARHFLDQQDDPLIRRKFIWLIRDGRAVVASSLRKHPGLGVWAASRSWARAHRKKASLIRRQNRDDVIRIGYEQALADTPGTLARLCDFLGVPYEPAMMAYWQNDPHFLGGSPGAVSAVARKRNIDALHYVLRDRTRADIELGKGSQTLNRHGVVDLAFYNRSDPARFVDERWRRELTRGQLRLFALATLGLNRRLGYRTSTDHTPGEPVTAGG